MPSSAYLQGTVAQSLSGDSFQSRGSTPNEVLISSISRCALGEESVSTQWGAPASTAYASSNHTVGFQFVIAEPFLVQKVWWANGTTATTDAADVGVYTEAGTTLLVSGGSTNIATANVIQEKDCTDTLLRAPGRYWLVYAQNGTTATPIQSPNVSANIQRISGIAVMGGAVPLGATWTPVAATTLNVPYFGIAGRTQVA